MMNRQRILLIVLIAAMLLAVAGCSTVRGRTDSYSGYRVRTEKTAEQSAETEDPRNTRAPDGEAENYVLNRKSMKFHDPSCTGVKDIKEKNRWDYRGSRQSVLDMGYNPCKICNP